MESDDVKLLPPPATQRKGLPDLDRSTRRSPRVIALWTLIGLAVAFAIGYVPYHREQAAAAELAVHLQSTLPGVEVLAVRRSAGTSQLLLPGNITPITEASIFARATGYVRKRDVDIGDRVKANQVLAEIDSPEVDQQVAQARAALAQAQQQVGQTKAALEDAKARLELAHVTYQRYATLLSQNSVSKQDTDQQYQTWQSAQATVTAADANIAASQENVRAAQANLRRSLDMQAFEQVRAPFAGIVTARNFDVGALIGGSGASMSSGSSASSSATIAGSAAAGAQGGELFRVAQIDRLRILVTVPQDNASTVRAGLPAKVVVPQYGSRVFDGTVTRTANALDPASRTMLTEIQVANRDGVLLPGMYGQVEFENTRTNPPLIVPADTLLARANGTQIAVLVDPRPEDRNQLQGADRDNVKQVHLQTVQIGRDYGTTVEIVGGLAGWEHIIVNPGDNAVENTLVLPHEAPAAPGPQPATGGTPGDRAPGGIASPGQAAPTQGPAKPGGTQRDGQPHGGPNGASPARSSRQPETRGR